MRHNRALVANSGQAASAGLIRLWPRRGLASPSRPLLWIRAARIRVRTKTSCGLASRARTFPETSVSNVTSRFCRRGGGKSGLVPRLESLAFRRAAVPTLKGGARWGEATNQAVEALAAGKPSFAGEHSRRSGFPGRRDADDFGRGWLAARGRSKSPATVQPLAITRLVATLPGRDTKAFGCLASLGIAFNLLSPGFIYSCHGLLVLWALESFACGRINPDNGMRVAPCSPTTDTLGPVRRTVEMQTLQMVIALGPGRFLSRLSRRPETRRAVATALLAETAILQGAGR